MRSTSGPSSQVCSVLSEGTDELRWVVGNGSAAELVVFGSGCACKHNVEIPALCGMDKAREINCSRLVLCAC